METTAIVDAIVSLEETVRLIGIGVLCGGVGLACLLAMIAARG